MRERQRPACDLNLDLCGLVRRRGCMLRSGCLNAQLHSAVVALLTAEMGTKRTDRLLS